MKYDYLIVGAGLYGATFACLAKRAGKRCLVIEKRPHVGGNLYCERMVGINVHKYGAHIFHTSNQRVWDFVQSFVEFNRYTNCPVANFHGQLYNLPFNMNTFYQLWGVRTPEEAKAKIEQQRLHIPKNNIANLEQQARSLVGQDIYEKLIAGYTQKQWGRACSELPADIIRRLPLRFVYDNNYFSDAYQGIPMGGYNKLFEGLLQGVDVLTNMDFLADNGEGTPSVGNWRQWAENLVFTGRIDAYFKYRLGRLEYRTVRFETEVLDSTNYQGNAVVNYTDAETPYTRVIEHKHFEMFGEAVEACPQTVISREFPEEWSEGKEAFYPINTPKNRTLRDEYMRLAAKEQNVHFGGRLAEYKYYDMAPIVEKVLDFWNY